MNEDTNPNPQPGSASLSSEELAQAFEDLVSNAPFRISTRQNNFGPDAGPGFAAPWAGPCPDAGDWILFAGGELSPAKGQALLAHAALCTSCLNRLRESQRVLSPETAANELDDLKQFASTSAPWQRRLALELAQTSHGQGRMRRMRQLVWAAGSLAAALVLAIGGLFWWGRANAPERLMAQAYTQARTFDLRVPGAGFAPVTPALHLRGGSADNEPAPLLSARAEIERKLQQSPNDAHWLQMQARAEVLEERYDGAIDTLDRLLAAGPVTSSLLLDDGMAYYLRGTATGSENDRATALDNLRRADELAPNDPVILFNEAIVMEDRGQVMNAVETWNRFVKFETDPKWRQEGQQRLQSLEEKLNRVKTHESRMEQHLATPQSMRALAAAPATLAGIDEELSTTFLPQLLDAAYPAPGDRSRGSPCDERCLAARSLLDALAASLRQNHQDSWLKEFLPSDPTHIPNEFPQAAHALGQAIDADTRGDYAAAQTASLESRDLFRGLGNLAGVDRAEVERAYALQRSYTFAKCHDVLQKLTADPIKYFWIKAQAVALDAACDIDAGSAATMGPKVSRAGELAHTSRYVLLELRTNNVLAMGAVESDDTETAWRMCMTTLHKFYEGDYPPFRAATTMSGLASVEDSTPRVQLDWLVNREAVSLFSLSNNASLLSRQRTLLIRAALRTGSPSEAREQLANAKQEMVGSLTQEGSSHAFQAETEIAMARLFLNLGDLSDAGSALRDAQKGFADKDNPIEMRDYAVARGELDLAQNVTQDADKTLTSTILHEEEEATEAGQQNIVFAREDRDLYAELAGIWLVEGRNDAEILSLWERYRLRILGKPVERCRDRDLDCLKPKLESALSSLGNNRVLGQIVLRDRTLLYEASAKGVSWRALPLQQENVLAITARFERVVSSPTSSEESIEDAARRVGAMFFGDSLSVDAPLLLEPDPILGNVPWPAVEARRGSIGLQFDLQETPSFLLSESSQAKSNSAPRKGDFLVVGASQGASERTLLPEALNEANDVARFGNKPKLLLADQATEPHVAQFIPYATVLHFAGHATQYDGGARLLLAPSGAPGDHPYLDSALLRQDPPKAARLVVFSACSSGKREAGWDHGMGDIVDTLASLGVPEVVATRWQIDSASAVPMMDAFYRGLAKGMSVPRALTAARLSLIRDARYRRPYYWAAYYASGVGSTDLHEVFHGSSN